jgi:hypothetical protein
MAIVKYGAIVTDINGKVGGSIFKQVASQVSVLQNRTARNPRGHDPKYAASQTANMKTITASIAQQWREFSDVERNAWKSAAQSFVAHNRAGNKITLSGYAYFMKVNCNLVNGFNRSIGAPTPLALLTQLTNVSYTASTISSLLNVNWANSLAADEYLIVSATPMQSIGRGFDKTKLRTIAAFGDTAPSPFQCWTPYSEVFGTPVTNQTIWLALQVTNALTGQISPPIYKRLTFL